MYKYIYIYIQKICWGGQCNIFVIWDWFFWDSAAILQVPTPFHDHPEWIVGGRGELYIYIYTYMYIYMYILYIYIDRYRIPTERCPFNKWAKTSGPATPSDVAASTVFRSSCTSFEMQHVSILTYSWCS